MLKRLLVVSITYLTISSSAQATDFLRDGPPCSLYHRGLDNFPHLKSYPFDMRWDHLNRLLVVRAPKFTLGTESTTPTPASTPLDKYSGQAILADPSEKSYYAAPLSKWQSLYNTSVERDTRLAVFDATVRRYLHYHYLRLGSLSEAREHMKSILTASKCNADPIDQYSITEIVHGESPIATTKQILRAFNHSFFADPRASSNYALKLRERINLFQVAPRNEYKFHLDDMLLAVASTLAHKWKYVEFPAPCQNPLFVAEKMCTGAVTPLEYLAAKKVKESFDPTIAVAPLASTVARIGVGIAVVQFITTMRQRGLDHATSRFDKQQDKFDTAVAAFNDASDKADNLATTGYGANTFINPDSTPNLNAVAATNITNLALAALRATMDQATKDANDARIQMEAIKNDNPSIPRDAPKPADVPKIKDAPKSPSKPCTPGQPDCVTIHPQLFVLPTLEAEARHFEKGEWQNILRFADSQVAQCYAAARAEPCDLDKAQKLFTYKLPDSLDGISRWATPLFAWAEDKRGALRQQSNVNSQVWTIDCAPDSDECSERTQQIAAQHFEGGVEEMLAIASLRRTFPQPQFDDVDAVKPAFEALGPFVATKPKTVESLFRCGLTDTELVEPERWGTLANYWHGHYQAKAVIAYHNNRDRTRALALRTTPNTVDENAISPPASQAAPPRNDLPAVPNPHVPQTSPPMDTDLISRILSNDAFNDDCAIANPSFAPSKAQLKNVQALQRYMLDVGLSMIDLH